MKDIKQRISSEIYKVWDMTSGVDEVTAKIIEEIIKPIAKEAFEAGVELGDNNLNITYLSSDEWIKEKFKV